MPEQGLVPSEVQNGEHLAEAQVQDDGNKILNEALDGRQEATDDGADSSKDSLEEVTNGITEGRDDGGKRRELALDQGGDGTECTKDERKDVRDKVGDLADSDLGGTSGGGEDNIDWLANKRLELRDNVLERTRQSLDDRSQHIDGRILRIAELDLLGQGSDLGLNIDQDFLHTSGGVSTSAQAVRHTANFGEVGDSSLDSVKGT